MVDKHHSEWLIALVALAQLDRTLDFWALELRVHVTADVPCQPRMTNYIP